MTIKVHRNPHTTNRRAHACGWLPGLLLVLLCLRAQAGPLVTTESPIGFFTNIASRLLSAQMGLDLNHIQVYPTNQYTPAVHRVLQVTANLYDAATNQPFASDYPFLPTVFRPLFRQDTNGGIFIAGYREVTNDVVARFDLAAVPNVVLGVNNSAVPAEGIPFNPSDYGEPLVTGIPLVIGAKKGLPNFNEFGMQTSVTVYRKLQFCRQGTSNTSPIVETNQMYLLSITNTWGVEAWNSYQASYPRNLEVRLDAALVAVMTNEFGTLLLSNAVPRSPVIPQVATNTWLGFSLHSLTLPTSFRALVASGLVLTNSTYSDSLRRLVLPGDFEHGNGFPVPHWYLSLRPILRFALVDTSVSPVRIVDYVSLDSTQGPTDLVALLGSGGQCGAYYSPSSDPSSLWCTNRNFPSIQFPTYGILNQINVSLGDLTSSPWFPSAHWAEVDFFRWQFGLSPLYSPYGTYSLTNTFYSPFTPVRIVNWYTSWQANDPLVHYTVADLTDGFAHAPPYELDTTSYSSLGTLGGLDLITGGQVGSVAPLNSHYRPWGGNPKNAADTTPASNWDLGLKDPLVRYSDDWNFPTNPPPDLSWLGQVHRGTPWQTIYLKSRAVDWTSWLPWTGDFLVSPGMPSMLDAALTHPTNDWRLASLLVSLLSANDPRSLLSVNDPSLADWTGALDGLTALTNTSSDSALRNFQLLLPPQTVPMQVDANSPQAGLIATGVAALRAGQPGQRFLQAGDVLAAPELSVASPFLNQGSLTNTMIRPAVYTYQQTYGISEAAYEALPSQLLPRLRPDSVASILPGAGPLQVQFTGADGYRYSVQTSSNLVDWADVCTNYPSNGQFLFEDAPPASAGRRFYRSVLLP